MKAMSKRRFFIAFIIYAVIDTICVGMGMGVPIFCILLGFPVGWYITKHLIDSDQEVVHKMNRILKYAFATAGFTFVFMVVIWGRMLILLGNPGTDYQNFGIPFILYDPKLSFIGWLVLMTLISPFLQLLTTIFASFLTLRKKLKQVGTNREIERKT